MYFLKFQWGTHQYGVRIDALIITHQASSGSMIWLLIFLMHPFKDFLIFPLFIFFFISFCPIFWFFLSPCAFRCFTMESIGSSLVASLTLSFSSFTSVKHISFFYSLHFFVDSQGQGFARVFACMVPMECHYAQILSFRNEFYVSPQFLTFFTCSLLEILLIWSENFLLLSIRQRETTSMSRRTPQRGKKASLQEPVSG